ncbi:serine--tRNA ligase [Lacihabitans sp. CS3-21]|jgi:seryl-tRNA synthetase|uniref:serine--tRNA ligase n=1 Tax=Lacihabitans sp. CS3-21 TaxID=2487332 RepID=UPI000BD2A211|nr:serine--tRNA ligase [Lacihabitans sp. CS3-21]MCP9748755.1 serine--tRNA ligase [Lacihabitans sp. CS3-21]MDP1812924.1 serine--tRNA ligase [Leadbetterella sp.]OYU65196.1 MAG: serine--tRNA ligase [Cytophagaceae bacterium BCCC1]
MLQLNFIKENKDLTIKGLERKYFKNAAETVEQVLSLDQIRKDTQLELDNTLAQSNNLAKEIGALMKEGKKEEAEAIKGKTAELKVTSKDLEEKLKELEVSLLDILVTIPNLPHESVPAGKTPDENLNIFSQGEIPKLHAEAQPHWELIKKYDIIDFELGNKVSGAGFPFYKGKGAKIQRALINFFLNEAEAAGYFEVQPPIVINAASGFGTGQLPDKEGQMYHATADDLYLIPTAEVPITNMYRDVILNDNDLPIKNVAYTPCFRREAGSWGAHVRGLNRLHQFDKVEIVQVRKPEESYQALEEMLEHVKGLLTKLELPFRILRLCGGDMSFTSALTFDFEVFSAAQERWLEVSSVSNFETYQANRLKLRYKVDGKTKLLHTLNGSALALPRILAAILENNQTSEGIKVPKALQAFCGFEMIK